MRGNADFVPTPVTSTVVVVATIVWGRVLVQIESLEVVLRGGNVHMVTDDGRLVIEELQLLEDGRKERRDPWRVPEQG